MPDRRGRSPEDIKRSMETAKKMMARSKEKELIKDLKWARGVVLAMGIITLLWGALHLSDNVYSNIEAFIDIGIGIVVTGLFFWSKEKPYEAILVTLIIFGASWIIMFLINPLSILNGVFFKIIIISGLITGLRAANKVKKRPKQNEELLDDMI